MTAFDGVRRSRTRVMVGVLAAALALVALFGFLGVTALTSYEGAKQVESDAASLPATPVAMLATVDDMNALSSVTLLVLRPGDAPGGHIVSVPVSVDSSLGVGEMRTPLTEAYTAGGIEGLQFAVESALTISPDVVAIGNSTQIAQWFASLGAEVAASTGAALTARTEGQLERDRTASVEQAWVAVTAAVGAGLAQPPVAESPAGTYSTLADITARLFAGPVESRSLPVTAADAATNPDGKDVDELDRSVATMVLAAIAPANMSTPAPGMVFRIEAPAGYDDKVELVINYLLSMGCNVKSVVLTAAPTTDSLVLVGDFKFREQLKSQGFVIDDLDMKAPPQAIAGIDIILMLGTDFLDGIATDDPTYNSPSTTTSTTTA